MSVSLLVYTTTVIKMNRYTCFLSLRNFCEILSSVSKKETSLAITLKMDSSLIWLKCSVDVPINIPNPGLCKSSMAFATGLNVKPMKKNKLGIHEFEAAHFVTNLM